MSTDPQNTDAPSREQIDRLIGLYQQGKLREVSVEGEALAQQFPGVPGIHNLLGVAYVAAGQLQQAEASFSTAIRLNPKFAEAHYSLGSVYDGLGKMREAIASYTEAIRCKPDYAKAHNNLGICLLALGLLEPAVDSFRRAIECQADLVEAHNNLGNALDRLKQPEQAVTSCRQAIALKPDYPEAHNNLGNALLHIGELDEARASYQKAIELKPDYAEAHRNLSSIKSYQPDDPHIGELERLVTQPDIPAGGRMLLHFALGTAYHGADNFDHAFAHYQEGNRLQALQRGHDRTAVRERFNKVVSAFSGDVPVLDTAADQLATAGRQLIFIVGMPRSGTSLVEQILASHSELYGAGELELLDRSVAALDWGSGAISTDLLRKLRDRYLAGIAGIGTEKPFVTDKMPFNFWWIGFIVATLPQAKIVHVTRDARAVCWSNFRHYYPFQGITFTNDFGDLADYYSIYREMMDFWHDRHAGRIYDLSYEALTENQTDETRKLLQYLGMPWQNQCLDFHRTRRPVLTASAAQVRSSMFKGSSEGWREYVDHLGPMVELLKEF